MKHKTVAIDTSRLDIRDIARAIDDAYERINRQMNKGKVFPEVISSNLIKLEKGLILTVVWENKPEYMVRQEVAGWGSTPRSPLDKV